VLKKTWTYTYLVKQRLWGTKKQHVYLPTTIDFPYSVWDALAVAAFVFAIALLFASPIAIFFFAWTIWPAGWIASVLTMEYGMYTSGRLGGRACDPETGAAIDAKNLEAPNLSNGLVGLLLILGTLRDYFYHQDATAFAYASLVWLWFTIYNPNAKPAKRWRSKEQA